MGGRGSRSAQGADERSPILENSFENEPLKSTAVLASVFAGFSGLTLGYDIGVSNGSLAPVAKTFNLGDAGKSLFVGSMTAAAFLGCLVGGRLGDSAGRRGAISIGALLFLVGNFGMALAPTLHVLIISRMVVGVAIGMTLVVEPLYTAEVSPRRLRGMLTTNVEVALNVGIVWGFFSSWAVRNLPHEVSWRYTMAMGGLSALVSLLAMLCLVPESPRWLALQGQLQEAETVLHSLVGKKEAEATMEALLQEARAPKEDTSWWTMLTTSPTRWQAFVGAGVCFFAHASGLEAIMYYSGLVFMEAGMSEKETLAATLLMGIVKLAAILTCAVVVDTLGRRPLLVLSGAGMGLSMLLMGAAFQLDSSSWVKITAAVLFAVMFSVGYGPIHFTLNSEIYSTAFRSKGLALSLSVTRLMSSVVSFAFLPMANAITMGGVFHVFAVLNLLGVLFVLACVPETRCTALEAPQLHSNA